LQSAISRLTKNNKPPYKEQQAAFEQALKGGFLTRRRAGIGISRALSRTTVVREERKKQHSK
jgi:hypothetical protein